MKKLSSRLAIAGAVLAWSAAACIGPFAAEDGSWMVATVLQADSTTGYAGGGSFSLTGGHLGYPHKFSIKSNGSGDSEGQRVMFTRPGEGRAPASAYVFGPWDGEDGDFTGLYFRTRRFPEGDLKEVFAVQSGWLEITSSSDDRVEGRFRFTARLYCTHSTFPDADPTTGSNCDPSRPVDGALPVELDGSFSVGPPGPLCLGSLGDESC